MKSYLEFERDVKVLEEELEKLKDPLTKKEYPKWIHKKYLKYKMRLM